MSREVAYVRGMPIAPSNGIDETVLHCLGDLLP
jgi:hypothetical protein